MSKIADIRKEFPILHQEVNGKPLIYLDNAATTHKPRSVINTIHDYYSSYNSNIHRGAHYLAAKATDAYEEAREKIANHLNTDAQCINFVRGTTEAVNLVANTWGISNIKEGDEIIVSGLEHHSNMVPWQMLCEIKDAQLRIIPVKENGDLDLGWLNENISAKTKLIAVNHVSNAFGVVNPIQEIIQLARKFDVKVFIDGAQAIPHLKVDVKALDADFYAFSGHKVYGPTGIGVLYGKRDLLEAMPPYHGGGEMIKEVSYNGFTVNELPYKFEAGTPNICGAIALGAAIDFINQVEIDFIANHENDLLNYATAELKMIDDLVIFGDVKNKAGAISFLVKDIHPYDLGVLLDKQGVAIRTGHHCCQPLMHRFAIEGTARISFAIYNTKEEINQFIKALQKAKMILQ